MDFGRRQLFRIPICLIAIPLLLCVGLTSLLHAQDQTIGQMVHTSWTGKDRAPLAIKALAQTPDGMLWIGSSGGLFSFDGLKFSPFSPKYGSPSLSPSSIRSLMVSKQGDLCVFFFHGAPACIHQGSVRFYDQAGDELINVLNNAGQDSDGAMWAILNWRYLVRLEADQIWHKVPNPTSGAGHISNAFIDSSNTMWVIENNLLYKKSHGTSTFTATDIHVYGPAKFAENRDRTLWVLGDDVGPGAPTRLQRIDSTGHRLFAPRIEGHPSDIVVAGDDSVWIQSDVTLRRLRPEDFASDSSRRSLAAPDAFELRTGIPDVALQGLLRDADGNIWVGGMGGLDRFEHASLVPAIVPSKVAVWFTCADVAGNVWVATGEGQLFSINNGRATQILNGGGGTNLFCGTRGRSYLIQDGGISVVSREHIRHLPLLPGLTGYGDHYLFLGLVESPDGGVIAAVGGSAGHGLWRYSKGRWSPYLKDLEFPEVCSMLDDGPNGLYLAFTLPDNRIGNVKQGSLETQSVPIGTRGLARTSYGVVAYGAKGIAIKGNKDFRVLSFVHPEHAKFATGVVEARNGDLWLMGTSGVVRVPAKEVQAALADPAHSVSSVDFQEGDFVGPDVSLLFRHSADIDNSGRLWFSTLNGVVSVDPDHLPAPPHPPLLSIRSIVADGHEMDASATFSPDTHTLDVKYFGLDLTDPKRVVYRFRLQGMGLDSRDSSWSDASVRTEATYTHLRPGSYRFEVMASNGNDMWTQPVSSVTFRLLPHFYERPWVQGLFLLAGVLLAWIGISLRVNYISNSFRIRAEDRADERVRIARELHDTLLQGIQGLLLTFHVAAEKVPADHVSRKALDKALTTADRIIVEGRNRVSRLRSEKPTDAELKTLIEGVAGNLNSTTAIEFSVERMGGTDVLQCHLVDEIFCIAREALTNAFRHSGASRIVVELDYKEKEFRMSCCDNGRGFDAEALRAGQTNGHWGLRGMEERAENIGAALFLRSAANKGTDVRVTLPARIAYVRRHRFGVFSKRDTAA